MAPWVVGLGLYFLGVAFLLAMAAAQRRAQRRAVLRPAIPVVLFERPLSVDEFVDLQRHIQRGPEARA